MGLGDMGEMEIPAQFGGAGGGMSEEDQIAAAIQASLQEMNLNAPSEEVKQPEPPTNQISQQSIDFLNDYAGAADPQS